MRQAKRWKVLVPLVGLLLAMGLYAYAWWDNISVGWEKIWNYERPLASAQPFFDRIRDADRIVVRDGGFNCCASIDKNPILFTVTDPADIQDVFSHIQFVPFTNALTGGCMCCGYPGIDWYRKNRRVALTAVQHGHGIRWREFGTSYSGPFRHYGDLPLTIESSIWIIEWLRRHGATNDSDYSEQRLEKLKQIANRLPVTD